MLDLQVAGQGGFSAKVNDYLSFPMALDLAPYTRLPDQQARLLSLPPSLSPSLPLSLSPSLPLSLSPSLPLSR